MRLAEKRVKGLENLMSKSKSPEWDGHIDQPYDNRRYLLPTKLYPYEVPGRALLTSDGIAAGWLFIPEPDTDMAKEGFEMISGVPSDCLREMTREEKDAESLRHGTDENGKLLDRRVND